MKRSIVCIALLLAICVVSEMGTAQRSAAQTAPIESASAVVPNLINYSGVLKDSTGRTVSSITGVTFLLYKDEQGGNPLWMETQNVTPDKSGHYTVQLGSTTASGLPSDLFVNGEARWLAVQVGNEVEQPRILLVAVPYAMKAADAQTLGGMPASAFMLASTPHTGSGTNTSANATTTASSKTAESHASSDVTTTGGTINAIPLFSTATNIQNSIVTQTSTTAVNVAGKLNLPATAAATAAAGKNSQPQDYVASSYNSASKTAVPQTFQLQAEPLGNNTATPSGTLNLLYGSGTAAPTETGLKISNKGLITFATGQTFPGTGDGTITEVTAGTGLTGGGTKGTVTLSLNTTVVPELSSANNFTGNLSTNGELAAGGKPTGNVASGTIEVDAGAKNTGSYGPGLLFAGGGESIASNRSSSGGNQYSLNFFTNYTNRMTITNTGNVGIGTTTPQGQLEIDAVGNGLNVQSSAANGDNAIVGELTSAGSYNGAILGWTNGTLGYSYGVEGEAASSADGSAIGVYGLSGNSAGIGVFGEALQESATGQNYNGGPSPIGVWGDGGPGSALFGTTGILATADDGSAGILENNSPDGFDTVDIIADNSNSAPLSVEGTLSEGYCQFGVFNSSGKLALECPDGFIEDVAVDGGLRQLSVASIQSPNHWFEDAGSGQLINGVAVIAFDPEFVQMVNTGMDYKVFPVPNGDCKGLYVTHKTAASFEVHELGGGNSNITFDYRIMALRKGYETVRLADRTAAVEKWQQMQARRRQRSATRQSHDPVKRPALSAPAAAKPNALSSNLSRP